MAPDDVESALIRGTRVGAGIWDVLCHFLHDERIADHKADDSGPLASGCFADDRTVIKRDRQHYPVLPTAFSIVLSSSAAERAFCVELQNSVMSG